LEFTKDESGPLQYKHLNISVTRRVEEILHPLSGKVVGKATRHYISVCGMKYQHMMAANGNSWIPLKNTSKTMTASATTMIKGDSKLMKEASAVLQTGQFLQLLGYNVEKMGIKAAFEKFAAENGHDIKSVNGIEAAIKDIMETVSK